MSVDLDWDAIKRAALADLRGETEGPQTDEIRQELLTSPEAAHIAPGDATGAGGNVVALRPFIDRARDVLRLLPTARLFPLKPGVNGGRGGYLVRSWNHEASRNDAQLRAWSDRHPNANIGVCDVVAIDVDTKKGRSGETSFEALGLPPDAIESAVIVRTPSGGRHYVWSIPEGADPTSFRSLNGWDSNDGSSGANTGLDLKVGSTGYVAALGSVTERGRYELVSPPDRIAGPCPNVVFNLITKRMPKEKAKAGQVAAGAVIDDPAMIEKMTAYLKNDAPEFAEGTRNATAYTIACRLKDHGLSEGETLALVEEHWNLDPDFSEEIEGVVASAYGGNSQNKVGSRHPGCFSPALEFGGVNMGMFEEMQQPEHKARKRSKWLYRHGDELSSDTKWLIYGRFPLIGTAMIVGPSGAGKTFLAADLCRAVATGEAFLGERPDDRGGAVLLAAEGVSGLPDRLYVLGDKATPLPIFGATVSNLRSKEEQQRVEALLDDAAKEFLEGFGVPLRLINLDTLAQSGLLSDENSNAECSEAVKFLERLASRYKCLVVAVHHPPKHGTGARGGYALHCGFDTVVEIFRKAKDRERFVECTKGRDVPEGDWGSFVLDLVSLGADGRGRPRTTMRIVPGAAKRSDKVLTFIDSAAVDAIIEAAGDKQWRKDWQARETSIIDLIAGCADLDSTTTTGRKMAKDYLDAMLESGTLMEGVDRIGRKKRPVVFVPPHSP